MTNIIKFDDNPKKNIIINDGQVSIPAFRIELIEYTTYPDEDGIDYNISLFNGKSFSFTETMEQAKKPDSFTSQLFQLVNINKVLNPYIAYSHYYFIDDSLKEVMLKRQDLSLALVSIRNGGYGYAEVRYIFENIFPEPDSRGNSGGSFNALALELNKMNNEILTHN